MDYDAIDKVSSSGSSLTLRGTETDTITLYAEESSMSSELYRNTETVNFKLNADDKLVIITAQLKGTIAYDSSNEDVFCTGIKIGNNNYKIHKSNEILFYSSWYDRHGIELNDYSLSTVNSYITCKHIYTSIEDNSDYILRFYYYK